MNFIGKEGLSEATTGLSAILEGVSTLTTVVGDVFNMITGNPLLCVFAGAAVITVGIGIFRSLKRASR